jgi:formate hydrogenlyase subunit 6/NADH:ubiquinone oxidoreductase subunit I
MKKKNSSRGTDSTVPIVYFSASNNTKYLAEIIAQGILSKGLTPILIPVTKVHEYTKELRDANTLGIGSPIYAEFAPPIQQWVKTMDFQGKKIFLFSTAAIMFFGSCTQMKNALESKSGTVVGGFEMRFTAAGDGFFYNKSLSQRFPLSATDIENAFRYGQQIATNILTEKIQFLDYRKPHHLPTLTSFFVKRVLKDPLVAMFVHFVPRFTARLCTQCKLCEHICPTQAIHIKESKIHPIDPLACIMCFQCAKQCPTHALYIVKNKRFTYYQGPWQLTGYVPAQEIIKRFA